MNLDLPNSRINIARDVLLDNCGAQKVINVLLCAEQTLHIVKPPDSASAILDTESTKDNARSALTFTSFPKDIVLPAPNCLPTTG